MARGIAEELGLVLTREAWVSVVGPSSARYHLQGSLRSEACRIRLTLRLLEARSGQVLWADRFDSAGDEGFSFEERVVRATVRVLEPTVRAAEIARAERKPLEDLSPQEMTMRALPAAMALEPSGAGIALELLDRAMERAPDYALAAALASWCHVQRAAHHFTANPAQETGEALALAQRALHLDRGDPRVLTILSGTYTLAHDLDTAEALVDKALLLAPSSAWAWTRSGWIHCYRGNAHEADERFRLALALGPGELTTFLCQVGIASAEFMVQRYDAAVGWWRRSLVEQPRAVWVNRFQGPALAFSDHPDEARLQIAALRDTFPDLTITEVRRGLPLPAEYLDRVADGLDHLGMPL
jgi:hypothetical protein